MIKEIFIDFARPFLFLFTMLIPSQKYVYDINSAQICEPFLIKKKITMILENERNVNVVTGEIN